MVERLLPANVSNFLQNKKGPQGPDLLAFRPNLSDWFFCEVKGPPDTVRPPQLERFVQLEAETGQPVRYVKGVFAKTQPLPQP